MIIVPQILYKLLKVHRRTHRMFCVTLHGVTAVKQSDLQCLSIHIPLTFLQLQDGATAFSP